MMYFLFFGGAGVLCQRLPDAVQEEGVLLEPSMAEKLQRSLIFSAGTSRVWPQAAWRWSKVIVRASPSAFS